jgi:hypothetical protein
MYDVPNIADVCSESFECIPGMAPNCVLYYYYYYYILFLYYYKHDIKELQQTAILGTAEILRTVLTQKHERFNIG